MLREAVDVLQVGDDALVLGCATLPKAAIFVRVDCSALSETGHGRSRTFPTCSPTPTMPSDGLDNPDVRFLAVGPCTFGRFLGDGPPRQT
jgi:hypothetical protein